MLLKFLLSIFIMNNNFLILYSYQESKWYLQSTKDLWFFQ